jgi:peptide chain release factor subunit 1
VLAGSADFKVVLSESEKFDPRLAVKVLKTVDVSYGGENGFNQAIELSQETLGNVRFVQEKKLISQYFEQISQDTGKFCFGIEDTLKGLEMGAVQILIVWENLSDMRYTLKDPSTGEEVLKHLTVEGEKDPTNFQTKEGVELEVIDKVQLVEWFATNYKNFGATLEFVTNRSQEGSQFVKGFGGVGGILRYKVDFMEHGYDEEDSD